MARSWYIAFATPDFYGSGVAKYDDHFDFVDATHSLNAKHPKGAVILFVSEITQEQFNKFDREISARRRPPARLRVVSKGIKH